MPSYLPTPYCAPDALSRALWLLSRPEGVQPGDTDSLFPVVETLDESGWLLVDNEQMMNVHEGALTGGELPPQLRAIFAAYVTAGALPENAENVLKGVVEANLGGRIPASLLLPQELLTTLLDFQEMVAQGKLNEPGGMM